jgi:hypothetical protein
VVAAVVTPTTPEIVVKTPLLQAGVRIETGDVSQPTLITVYQIPGEHLLLTNLDQFGPYYQFTSTAASFNSSVLTGICTSASGSGLRLAHNVPDPNPTTIEILPLQNTNPLGLGCASPASGPSLNMGNFATLGLRALGNEISRLLSPEPLSAAVLITTGVGGSAKNFSTFGVVDTRVVSFQANGYRSLPLSCGEVCDTPPVGWETSGFDDSSWGPTLQAAFGNGSSSCPSLTPSIHSSWPGQVGDVPEILVRKHFTAPLGTTSVSIQLAIDDDAQVFINGNTITATASAPQNGGFVLHGGCAELGNPHYVFTANAGQLNIGGDNVIAVRGRDSGGDMTYLDLQATLIPEPPPIP